MIMIFCVMMLWENNYNFLFAEVVIETIERETHCYLLCGMERTVLIDIGLGVASVKNLLLLISKSKIDNDKL